MGTLRNARLACFLISRFPILRTLLKKVKYPEYAYGYLIRLDCDLQLLYPLHIQSLASIHPKAY